ncbi:hypothetical protein [Streptomyces sp. NPDC048428]|uniref:hypothetical protein n=1 Tax=Streptomyces sp. NPDC048428 TaxID=3154503 RepID=UPI00344A6551
MLTTVLDRGRDEKSPAVALRWAEPSVGGAEVSAPCLLATAVFDGSPPAVPIAKGVPVRGPLSTLGL